MRSIVILFCLAGSCLLAEDFSAELPRIQPLEPDAALAVHANVEIATFAIDATPSVGAPLAYNPLKEAGGALSCRGLVVYPGDEKPIALVAIDWIGVGNDGYSAFREAIAAAAGTTAQRVAFHSLHQHDAPRCDFSADTILAEAGLPGEMFDTAFARSVISRLQEAIRAAPRRPVTHVGHGEAEVKNVASNRRILGPNGKVRVVRFTACRNPKIRAEPVGIIDPQLKLISFWNGDRPVTALSYYATHPQSCYRTGKTSPDFPGLARNQRDAALANVLHIHFNGAGGNVGAGKWNDGNPKNRPVLAGRVAEGMARAWAAAAENRHPLQASDIAWRSIPVLLPASEYGTADELARVVADSTLPRVNRIRSAVHLAWHRRCEASDPIDISCLTIGKARVLHLPGELFVEYQLAAQKLRPDLFVAMAAYGDYAPGYIGTEIAYDQGGYETTPLGSRVAPGVEGVLLSAIRQLLGTDQ